MYPTVEKLCSSLVIREVRHVLPHFNDAKVAGNCLPTSLTRGRKVNAAKAAAAAAAEAVQLYGGKFRYVGWEPHRQAGKQ
jgi:hypothetical protein